MIALQTICSSKPGRVMTNKSSSKPFLLSPQYLYCPRYQQKKTCCYQQYLPVHSNLSRSLHCWCWQSGSLALLAVKVFAKLTSVATENRLESARIIRSLRTLKAQNYQSCSAVNCVPIVSLSSPLLSWHFLRKVLLFLVLHLLSCKCSRLGFLWVWYLYLNKVPKWCTEQKVRPKKLLYNELTLGDYLLVDQAIEKVIFYFTAVGEGTFSSGALQLGIEEKYYARNWTRGFSVAVCGLFLENLVLAPYGRGRRVALHRKCNFAVKKRFWGLSGYEWVA